MSAVRPPSRPRRRAQLLLSALGLLVLLTLTPAPARATASHPASGLALTGSWFASPKLWRWIRLSY